MNNNERYTLTYALYKNEYNKVCRLKISKETWNSFISNYEDNEDMQLRKSVTLTHQYECFIMKDGESVNNMFGRMHFERARSSQIELLQGLDQSKATRYV